MAVQRNRPAQPPSSSAGDWAEQFFAAGWQGQPWVVVERLPGDPRRLAQDLSDSADGWLFGAFSRRILHAPTYDVYATDEVQRRIVEAIRAFPARRAAEFQAFERPSYERLGWPATVLDHIAPQADALLKGATFVCPVLLVAADPETGEYLLLGSVSSMDIVLPTLIRRRDVPVDDAMALFVLLTCHGDPGEGYAKSPFIRPLHPKRFRQVRRALRRRSPDDSADALRGELARLLLNRIPSVIESLRQRAPQTGRSVHAAARSRLAEAVSNELLARSHRQREEPWWSQLDQLSPHERRSFLRSLSPAERAELQARRRGSATDRNPATRRQHIHRAKLKLRNVLRTRRH